MATKHESQIFCWFTCHVLCGTDLLKSQLNFNVFSTRLWRPQHCSMLCAVYSHCTVASYRKYVRSSNCKDAIKRELWLANCGDVLFWTRDVLVYRCSIGSCIDWYIRRGESVRSQIEPISLLKITSVKLQDIHELAACRQQVFFYFVGSPTIFSTST